MRVRHKPLSSEEQAELEEYCELWQWALDKRTSLRNRLSEAEKREGATSEEVSASLFKRLWNIFHRPDPDNENDVIYEMLEAVSAEQEALSRAFDRENISLLEHARDEFDIQLFQKRRRGLEELKALRDEYGTENRPHQSRRNEALGRASEAIYGEMKAHNAIAGLLSLVSVIAVLTPSLSEDKNIPLGDAFFELFKRVLRVATDVEKEMEIRREYGARNGAAYLVSQIYPDVEYETVRSAWKEYNKARRKRPNET